MKKVTQARLAHVRLPALCQLARIRRLQGVTLASLAAAAGVTARHVAYLQAGTCVPGSSEIIEALAAALNVPARWLSDPNLRLEVGIDGVLINRSSERATRREGSQRPR